MDSKGESVSHLAKEIFCSSYFLPCGVYSGWGIVVTILVCSYVPPYVDPSEFFVVEIFGFLGLSRQ